jgi:hypothetical protein
MISKEMPGRTANALKNRYNTALKKYNSFEDYMACKKKKIEKIIKRRCNGIYKPRRNDRN